MVRTLESGIFELVQGVVRRSTLFWGKVWLKLCRNLTEKGSVYCTYISSRPSPVSGAPCVIPKRFDHMY